MYEEPSDPSESASCLTFLSICSHLIMPERGEGGPPAGHASAIAFWKEQSSLPPVIPHCTDIVSCSSCRKGRVLCDVAKFELSSRRGVRNSSKRPTWANVPPLPACGPLWSPGPKASSSERETHLNAVTSPARFVLASVVHERKREDQRIPVS